MKNLLKKCYKKNHGDFTTYGLPYHCTSEEVTYLYNQLCDKYRVVNMGNIFDSVYCNKYFGYFKCY